MVHRLSFFLIWVAVVWAVEAARPAYILSDPKAKVIVKVTDAVDQKKYGGQLVASMNTTRAAQAINATGKMRIRDERGKPKDVGVVFRSAKLENTLVSVYSTVHETLNQFRSNCCLTDSSNSSNMYCPDSPARVILCLKQVYHHLQFRGSAIEMPQPRQVSQ